MARAKRNSDPAYFLVNPAAWDAETRDEIMQDAELGGTDFGVRVVEIVHNGPSQTNLYGVYYVDQDKWDAAKEEFEISDEDAGEGEMSEEALREAAELKTQEEADAAKADEEAEIARIAGEAKTTPNKAK